MSLRRRLAWATSISLAGSVVTALLSYPRNVIMARTLGPEQLGTLTLAGTIVGWAASICGLGLYASATKYAAERVKQPALLRGGVRWTIRVGLLSGLGGALVITLLSMPIGRVLFHQPRLVPVLVILSIGIPFTVLMNIASGVNLGLGHVSFQVVVNSIILPIAWTALVIVVWVGRLGLEAMASAQPAASLVAGLTAYVLAQKAIGAGDCALPKNGPSSILSVGFALFVSSLSYSLWLRMDSLFLGVFWGAHQVGLYTPALQTGTLLTYLVVAISSLFSPTVVALLASNSSGDLQRLYAETSRWSYYGNLPIALTLYVCAFSFLSLFGSDFATPEAVVSLRILVPCLLFYSLVGAMPQVLMSMGGKHKQLAAIEVSLVPTAIVFHLVFTRALGIVGAALSTGCALALVAVMRSVVVRRSFGYWGVQRSIWKGGVVLAVSALLAQRAYILSGSLHSWQRLVVVFIVAGLAELAMLFAVRDPTATDVWRELAKSRLTKAAS